jgi:hypothetical protein
MNVLSSLLSAPLLSRAHYSAHPNTNAGIF